MFDFYNIIIYPLIYILPAYVANSTPVIFGGGEPLDGRTKWRGKRLLGNNKTARGTIAGIVCGGLTGYIEGIFGYSYMFPVGVALAIGAMAGDLLGSFIKRRLDVQPGASVPLMDQYGFYVMALAFAYPFDNMPQVYGLVFITIITGFVHLFANVVAHKMKLKKVPW